VKKNIIFRAEVSPVIGRGHLSRCLAIADMLKDDFNVSFVFLSEEEDYASTLLKNYPYFTIKHENDLLHILNESDVLWIDGYHFKEDWKSKIKETVYRFVETNDIPYFSENVDVIFNHTPGLDIQQFKGTKADLYLGLDFALLRKNFLEAAKSTNQLVQGKGVFICFGGADTFELGEKFVDELLFKNFKDPIYWVSNKSIIDKKKYTDKNLKILSNLSEIEMIYYMKESKVMLIPSSVLSFEAMAIRKPIFTCYFVENQKLINKGLLQLHLASGVGYIETSADVKLIIDNFFLFYNNEELHGSQIQLQTKFLDGKSKERIRNIFIDL
jgi:spore coat polysaccharide biosynthesis predicted glycosyltransferase SpsG